MPDVIKSVIDEEMQVEKISGTRFSFIVPGSLPKLPPGDPEQTFP